MAKSLISWVVVGLFTFAWFYIGYDWAYLQNIPRGDWKPAYLIITLLTILIARKPGSAPNAGANVVEAITNRLQGIFPHLIGVLLALFVGLTCFSLIHGGFRGVEYVQAIAVTLGAALTTAAWLGAMEDASG